MISMSPPVTHMGSRQALLGAAAAPDLAELMSLDKQVGGDAADPDRKLIQ